MMDDDYPLLVLLYLSGDDWITWHMYKTILLRRVFCSGYLARHSNVGCDDLDCMNVLRTFGAAFRPLWYMDVGIVCSLLFDHKIKSLLCVLCVVPIARLATVRFIVQKWKSPTHYVIFIPPPKNQVNVIQTVRNLVLVPVIIVVIITTTIVAKNLGPSYPKTLRNLPLLLISLR